jgi:hypothetical protein
MQLRNGFLAVAFSAVIFAGVSRPVAAQPTSCTSSQQAAIECFVANAVATHLTQPRYGMTLAQFEAYGVAVNNILQTHHTYLMLVGVSSAIADAMPPKNANGSANQSAQDLAVTQIISGAVSNHLANTSTGVTLQDMEWFSLDVTNAMNDNDGVMAMLTPGLSLRLIDSYIVTGTTNGTVNWTTVNASISTAIDNFVASGMMKVTPPMTTTELKSFADTLAHVIANYKVATGRKTL